MAILIPTSAASITNTDQFGDITNFYKANAGDRVLYEFDLVENIFFRSSQVSPVTTSAALRAQNKLRFANYYSLNGFAAGQNVTLTYKGPQGQNDSVTTTIVSIDYSEFIVEFAAYFTGQAQNKDLFDNTATLEMYSPDLRSDFYLSLNFAPSTLEGRTNYVASLTENGYLNNVNPYRPSQIDGEKTLFYADTSALAVGASVSLSQQGKKSGNFNLLGATLFRDPDSGNLHVYRVRLEIVNPSTLFASAEAWRNSGLYLDTEWYSLSGVKTHPTVVQWFYNPAESGWFGEAYGGGIPNNNEPNSEVTQEVTNTIYYDSPTTHTIKIESTSPNIALFAHYYPNDEYNKNNYYDQTGRLMFLETFGPLSTGIYTSTPREGDSLEEGVGAEFEIEVLTLTYASNVHTVEFEFRFGNQEFIDFIEGQGETNRQFLIGVAVGNTNHIVFLGDLLRTPVPTNALSTYTPVGAPSYANYSTDSPNKTYGAEGASGNGGARVSIADNISFGSFAALPKFQRYNKLTFEVVAAEKADLTNRFLLESLSIDLTGSAYNEATGVTEFNITKQKVADQSGVIGFNTASITRFSPYPDELGRFQVAMVYPFLIDWKYWINESNAFAEFYPNQNRNYDNYDTATFGVYLRMLMEAEEFNIEHFAPIDTIKAYNETFTDVSAGEEWQGTASVEYFDESGTQQPVLLDKQQMKVVVTVNTVQPIGAVAGDFWGALTIEPLESSPRYVLSSNYAYNPNTVNAIIPLSGQDRLLATRVNANQATFEALIDTSILKLGDFTLTLKFMNISATLEQVRLKFDTKVKLAPIVQVFQEGKIIRECPERFIVYADQNSLDDDKNNVQSAWYKLLGEGDTVDFELYDQYGNLTNFQPSDFTFPNDPDARFTTFNWKSVLSADGYGCYELKLKYTNAYGGISFISWAKYELIPWSLFNLRGYVTITGVFNGDQDIESINFKGTNLRDSINVPGFFGTRQPNKEIDNVTLVTNEQIKVSRDNENSYVFKSAPVEDFITSRLSDLFFLSETNLFITDYNDFNHTDYTLKEVIVSESDEFEYPDISTKAVVTCTFRDKFRNQRSR